MPILFRLRSFLRKYTLEVIPQVYQITFRSDNVLLLVEEKLTLIDTGFRGSSAQIINFIHSLGRSAEEISLIILTHNHPDHTGGLAELRKVTRAKVAAHKADIADTGSRFSYPRFSQKVMRLPPLSTLHSAFSLKSGEVDIQLSGGEVLEPLGGLQVIPTPGHTPGSISLFSPQKKLLIVGDALNKRYKTPRFPPRMVSSDLAQAVESVKRLAKLDFDTICFGHGWPIIGDARAKVQELLEKVED